MTNAAETPPTAAAAAESKTTTAIEKVPTRMGVAPSTFEEGWRMSEALARSELVPANFRNKPADVFVAMQMAMELGLAPMQGLASIAVINGRAGLWGDGLFAIVLNSPSYQDHDEYFEVDVDGKLERRDGLTAADMAKDTTAAVCTFIRAGKATPVTRRFTIAQAKKGQLWNKSGPWQTYPDRMLAMRARTFAARDCFPDVLRGIHTDDELRELPPAETTTPTIAAPRQVHRLSEHHDDTPTRIVEAPPPTTVLEPATVQKVETFLGGFTVLLGGGITVDVERVEDARELETFVGTDHKVRMTVIRDNGGWRLYSFVGQ